MKFATRIKILIVLAVCTVTALIAGCSIGEKTADRFLKENGAQDKCVTYSASGGKFNDNNNLNLLHLYYKEENEVIYDFTKTSDISIARSGYVFNGWTYARLDADGNPVYDENKEYLVPSDRAVDTSVPVKLTSGEHLYLCAVWVPDTRVDVIIVIDGDTDGTLEATGTDGTKYKTGDVIDGKNFNTAGTVNISSQLAPTTALTDYTFLQYYVDKDCTEIKSGTISRPTDGGSENPVVYAKYIKGVWTVVRNDTAAANMLNNPVEGRNYYLYTENGSNVIDCSSRALSLKSYSDNTFITNCTIAGNGVTLKNLKFTVSRVSNGQICSIFGVFGKDAVVSDLTLENISVTINANGNIFAYLICESVEEGATLNNVTVNGATLTVSIPDGNRIDNIQKEDGVYNTSRWISESELNGVSITGEKLVIGEDTIVG